MLHSYLFTTHLHYLHIYASMLFFQIAFHAIPIIYSHNLFAVPSQYRIFIRNSIGGFHLPSKSAYVG